LLLKVEEEQLTPTIVRKEQPEIPDRSVKPIPPTAPVDKT
jgi:hypothetical protein